MSKHKPGIEQLIVEVNGHLPEGLKLVAPITKKAMRYARSCLAYTYKDDATATGEGARVLGPLNAALDRIEELVAKEKDAQTAPPTTPPPTSSTTPPRPSTTTPPNSSTTPPKTTSSSSSSSSNSGERWRQARDDETPAERTFREALEEVERRNKEKQAQSPPLGDAQKVREALDLVERYFAADAKARASVQELRRALLASLEQQRKAG